MSTAIESSTIDLTSSFWVEAEKRYDERHRSNPITLPLGSNFWLKDDMKYIVERFIGRGAFASVWRAKEREKGRVFAIKRSEAGDDPDTRRNVGNESQILDMIRAGNGVSTSISY